jgi:predicted dehydrogenase
VDLATSGALGPIHSYLGTFTFQGVTPGNYRLSPAHGGGALYDIGIYPLHGLVACLPDIEDFTVVDVSREMGGEGVDLTTQATLSWGSDTRGGIVGSFILPASQRLTVAGAEGEVRVTDDQAFVTWRAATSLWVDGHIEEFPTVDAYQIMFEEMSDRIQGGDGWLLPPRDSIRVARTVDSLLK